MVDNVTLNSGSGGATIAADDISGVQHQRVKVQHGADGSATDASQSSPLPVEAVGRAAENAAVAGNPVLTGGRYDASDRTLGDGDVGAVAVDVAGKVIEANSASIDFNTNAMAACVGTDGSTGPVSVLSVGGTESGGNVQEMRVDSDGHPQMDVVGALPAGANLIGDVGLSGARTSGGATPYKNIDVDETEHQVKGSAGQIFWMHVINLSNALRYLKIYNATAASVTVGTTVPDHTFPIPTQGDTNGMGFVLVVPNGMEFTTAITIAATTGVADNDTGAPGANEVVVNLGYA